VIMHVVAVSECDNVHDHEERLGLSARIRRDVTSVAGNDGS
jgi:hypothetical protein